MVWLALTRPQRLPPGPVQVHLTWRCAPQRNWVQLWKPTGAAMGPVLGERDPRNPFNSSDDRIVVLGRHLSLDRGMGYAVDVGMWWRAAAGRPHPDIVAAGPYHA